MTDSPCIFCRIIAGEVPAARILEDDRALAFLDIAPFEEGHMLVIPKHHARTLTDLPTEWLLAMMPMVREAGRRLLERLPCDGFNLLQSNGRCASQVVPHVHFHVIPRWNHRPLSWHGRPYASEADIQRVAEKLTAPA